MLTPPAPLRLLVVDGNTAELNARQTAMGGSATGTHYHRVLEGLGWDVAVTVVHPADTGGDNLPTGVALADFDGVAWTGSALNVYVLEPAVQRQVALAKAVFAAGVPIFGSCWGLQVATVAAGGVVHRNPRGREVGIARRITPSAAGAVHPLFEGKRGVFDAICVHMDEVATLPAGSVVLAANSMSPIQAVEIRHGAGVCWGVQYHPEYTLNEIATVMVRYGEKLVQDGLFHDLAAQQNVVDHWRLLHEHPDRRDLAWLYGIGPDILEPVLRHRELINWVEKLVMPYAASRLRAA
jgi:GMP synthase (glutamine-hydrolysing)